MEHGSINYIEFAARDISATKAFFSQVFDWVFEDYGPEYSAFEGKGLIGGFYLADLASDTSNGAALMVFYSKDLEQTKRDVITAGGQVNREIFSFPGGRRFHFKEPSGNEMAVWGDN